LRRGNKRGGGGYKEKAQTGVAWGGPRKKTVLAPNSWTEKKAKEKREKTDANLKAESESAEREDSTVSQKARYLSSIEKRRGREKKGAGKKKNKRQEGKFTNGILPMKLTSLRKGRERKEKVWKRERRIWRGFAVEKTINLGRF